MYHLTRDKSSQREGGRCGGAKASVGKMAARSRTASRSTRAAALTAHLLPAESVTCWGQKLCFVVYPQGGAAEEPAAHCHLPASDKSPRK